MSILLNCSETKTQEGVREGDVPKLTVAEVFMESKDNQQMLKKKCSKK